MTDFNPVTGLSQGSFGVGTFRTEECANFPAIIMPDGTVYDVQTLYRDTHAIFDDWERAFDLLNDIAVKGGMPEFEYPQLIPQPVCQRRSKIRPYGGAKVDQFLVERDGCKMAAASQPRSPNSWRLTGRFGPSGPNLDWLDQVAAFAFRARLWPSR